MAEIGKSGRRARAQRAEAVARQENEYQRLDFSRRNWILFGSGIACVILGFFALSAGSLTLAPLLLVIGYLVLIPWSIAARSRHAGQESGSKGAPRT